MTRFREEVPGFDQRHAVRPGLTGLAQLYGHADLRREKKLHYDLLYIRKRSLGLDLKLIGTSISRPVGASRAETDGWVGSQPRTD